MKVTLKRANFYANAALKAATGITYEPTVRLSIYSSATNDSTAASIRLEGEQAREKLLRQHSESVALITAAYVIRDLLGQANLSFGVSTHLNTIKALTAEEGRLNALVKAVEDARTNEQTAEAVLLQAQALRTQPTTDRYGYAARTDHVELGFMSADDSAVWTQRLARIVEERAGLNDRLTLLNVTNFVVLDKVTIETLRRANILVAVTD
jgi:hypothetical protein